MSRITRVLPPGEWARLTAGPLAGQLSALDLSAADHARIVVVEEPETGQILAYWALVDTVHAEPVWIDPARRGDPTVAASLLRATLAELQQAGVGYVYTTLIEGDVILEQVASRAGFEKLPVTLWAARIAESQED